MKNSYSPKKVFFTGIKGVGMTPLSLIYQDMGYEVFGSDTQEIQITDEILKKRNIEVKNFGESEFLNDINKVIYSGAYKLDNNPDLIKAKELGIELQSQADALAEIVNSKKSICICGVGGKTTTTSMLAHVLNELNIGSWFVGVSQINSQIYPGKWRNDQIMVVEADEYAINAFDNHNPKFSLYHPNSVICTNLAFDHPDIYKDFDQTIRVYSDFFNKIPDDGYLLIQSRDLEKIKNLLKPGLKIITFGFDDESDWKLTMIKNGNEYSYQSEHEKGTFNLSVIGQMNAANALSTGIILSLFKVGKISQILSLLSTYTGAKRRLELIRETNGSLYFDDYGHHPDEIKVTLNALKTRYPEKKLKVVFHPHTFSRTKTLLHAFAKELGLADELILAPIFSSKREIKDESISHQLLAQEVKKISNIVVNCFDSFDEIIDYIKTTQKPNEILLTLGAGDIYKIHPFI